MKRPEIGYEQLAELPLPEKAARQAAPLEDPVQQAQAVDQVLVLAKYSGYITRQQVEVERQEHFAELAIPADFDYLAVKALSNEIRNKLHQQRPETLGHAAQISGVTPAAISILLVHLRKKRGVPRAA